MNKKEYFQNEFKLFIQSIGFVYQKQSMGNEFYILDDYELIITYSHKGIFHINKKVQLGVTRSIASNSIYTQNEYLDVFKSIIREHKLNKLGI
jgi:hypothetical protein